MRTCPNCGHMLSDKDTICFKCGMQLSQLERANMGGMMPPQQPMRPNQPMNQKNNNRPMLSISKPNGKPGMKNGASNSLSSKSLYIVGGVIVLLIAVIFVIVFVGKNSKLDETKEKPQKEEEVILTPDGSGKTPQEDKKVEEPDPITEDPTEPEKPSGGNGNQGSQGGNQGSQGGNQGSQGGNGGSTETPSGGYAQVGENEHLVKNNGYSYAVPNEYIEKDYGTQGFDIIDYKKTKEMIISVNIGNVATLKTTLPAVKQMYIDAGAIVNDVKVQVIRDVEVICVELTKNGQNMIIGIADAVSGEIFTVAAYNVKTNSFDYDVLDEGIKIINSAVKYSNGSVQT